MELIQITMDTIGKVACFVSICAAVVAVVTSFGVVAADETSVGYPAFCSVYKIASVTFLVGIVISLFCLWL